MDIHIPDSPDSDTHPSIMGTPRVPNAMHGSQAQPRTVILEKLSEHLGTLRESCGTGALRCAIWAITMQHGTFVNHTFDLGVAIATFLSAFFHSFRTAFFLDALIARWTGGGGGGGARKRGEA